MPSNNRILISGAGIAGLTLTYWLKQFGFEPTLVERRPDLRDEGYMIDFYGSGFDVAEKMELLDALRARHYAIPKLVYVDGHGRPQASVDIDRFRRALQYRHFNFMRGDLETVLYEAVRPSVPVTFSTQITQVQEQPAGLAVELSDGTYRACDLVIGADGVHSHVRHLLWGEARQVEHFLGYYVACSIIPNILGAPDGFFGHLEPETNAAVYSIRGNRLATFFAFKSERLITPDRRAQLDILHRRFEGQGWIVPQLLEATQHADQLYFDAVTQIRLSPWHRGRVALVGDACQCLTLLAGQGASMAMTGAYLLALELQRAQGDFEAALAAYQARLAPEIQQRQAEAQKLARSFVPDSWFGVWMAHLVLRAALLPGVSALLAQKIGVKSLLK